jgi:tetratricopeptide (TPR) repeat protein
LFSELKRNNEALEKIEKAYSIAPHCPLVNHNLALIYSSLGNEKKAIKIWENLLSKDINDVAFDECGEGLKWTKSLFNDIRYDIALDYFELKNYQKAKKYIKSHINNRKRGQFSIYSLKVVQKKEKEILSKK